MESSNGMKSSIGYLLQHISGILSKQSDQSLQNALGIGFSQFKILRVLQNSPRIQQRQIAIWLGQTEASISRQIKIMIEKDLLRTTISPENRREHLTSLTQTGVRMTEEAIKVLAACHEPLFKDMSEKQQQQLLETLVHMDEVACPSAGCLHTT